MCCKALNFIHNYCNNSYSNHYDPSRCWYMHYAFQVQLKSHMYPKTTWKGKVRSGGGQCLRNFLSSLQLRFLSIPFSLLPQISLMTANRYEGFAAMKAAWRNKQVFEAATRAGVLAPRFLPQICDASRCHPTNQKLTQRYNYCDAFKTIPEVSNVAVIFFLFPSVFSADAKPKVRIPNKQPSNRLCPYFSLLIFGIIWIVGFPSLPL